MNKSIERARQLRQRQTKLEALLWSVLRARQLCNLKFRRQFPIKPYIVDFSCVAKRLVIEIDGGYHDYVGEEDLDRERVIKNTGWSVIRFSDQAVIEDPENIANAIAKYLEMDYEYRRRLATPSGHKKPRLFL